MLVVSITLKVFDHVVDCFVFWRHLGLITQTTQCTGSPMVHIRHMTGFKCDSFPLVKIEQFQIVLQLTHINHSLLVFVLLVRYMIWTTCCVGCG